MISLFEAFKYEDKAKQYNKFSLTRLLYKQMNVIVPKLHCSSTPLFLNSIVPKLHCS